MKVKLEHKDKKLQISHKISSNPVLYSKIDQMSQLGTNPEILAMIIR